MKPTAMKSPVILLIIFLTLPIGVIGQDDKEITAITELQLVYRPFGRNYFVAVEPLELISGAGKDKTTTRVIVRDEISLLPIAEAINFKTGAISNPEIDTRQETRSSDIAFIFLVGINRRVILTISADERVEWVNYSGPLPAAEIVNSLLDTLPARDLRKFLGTHKRLASDYGKSDK